jgi:hypothetical protein
MAIESCQWAGGSTTSSGRRPLPSEIQNDIPVNFTLPGLGTFSLGGPCTKSNLPALVPVTSQGPSDSTLTIKMNGKNLSLEISGPELPTGSCRGETHAASSSKDCWCSQALVNTGYDFHFLNYNFASN